jgi:UDPglucose 6-dehydrogenase
MGSDGRIGHRFLFPGVGYGGSCFPKDVEALKRIADQNNYDFQILDAVMQVNNRQKLKVFDKLKSHFGNNLKGKTIALWGLAFKPSTDDIREAPALYTIDALLEAGAHVVTFDPEAMDNVKAIYGDKIKYSAAAYDTLKGADALAILTEWSVFRSPDFTLIESTLNNKVIVDGRNLYDVNKMKERGFDYYSIGRPLIQK